MIDETTFWTLTILLGLGTFLIRFSFLGLLGDTELPEPVARHLRYVGVAVFPALVTPMVLWPDGGGDPVEPARIIAAVAALVAGLRISVTAAIFAGMGTLYLAEWLADRL